MITQFFLTLAFSIGSAILSIFPAGPDIPAVALSSIATIVSGAKMLNSFVPVYTLWSVILAGLGIELALMIYHIIQWVAKKLRITG